MKTFIKFLFSTWANVQYPFYYGVMLATILGVIFNPGQLFGSDVPIVVVIGMFIVVIGGLILITTKLVGDYKNYVNPGSNN